MADVPEGWTDDMRIALPPDQTAAEVADLVLQSALDGIFDAEIEQRLVVEFSLSPDDAALARDRSFGGLVRAATRNLENCPDEHKDPMAWHSFHRGIRDPSLIARIYPQFATKT